MIHTKVYSIRQFFIIFLCIADVNIYSSDIISVFFRPYPNLSSKDELHQNVKKYSQAHTQIKQHIKTSFNPSFSQGIFVSYAGYMTVSNSDGEVAFSRKHEHPSVYLVVTQRITPININHTTIHHWELDDNAEARFYHCTRKHDAISKAYFWEVSETERPLDRIIPLESLIIFANPESVYIPIGITTTTSSANLVLPDIYVKNKINRINDTLYILYLRHFFGPVIKNYKKIGSENRYTITVSEA